MTYTISIRDPRINIELVVNMHTGRASKPDHPPTFAAMLFRFSLSLGLPVAVAYIQAAALCGFGLAVCDAILGQPDVNWYRTLRLLTVLCSVLWFWVWRGWVMSNTQPVMVLFRGYLGDALGSCRARLGGVQNVGAPIVAENEEES